MASFFPVDSILAAVFIYIGMPSEKVNIITDNPWYLLYLQTVGSEIFRREELQRSLVQTGKEVQY